MIESDTIAAVATPPGVAAVAIVRISGPRARDVASSCFLPAHDGAWRPGHMRRGRLIDSKTGDQIDDALAVLFAAPNSYTGEDIVEFHVHGGAGVVASCLMALLTGGCRLAQAGEFTRRAFVNGRMDLAQAEAVADLIRAESRLSAKAAVARLEGALGRGLREMRGELLNRLVEIEAHVDYPDEVPEPDGAALAACIREQRRRIAEMSAGSGSAKALRDGIDCVIAGPPNAGKSSLLNALVDAERAIVSDIPGTTRDIVEDRVAVDGVVLRLRDTAGLRASTDAIETQGVARAKIAIDGAELVILVLDGSKPLGDDERTAIEATAGRPRITLCNKGDLGNAGTREVQTRFPDIVVGGKSDAFVAGSVRNRASIVDIRAAIAKLGWGGAVIDANTALIADGRQIEALARTREALENAEATIAARMPIDMVAVDLSAALASMGEVTGETVTEEVLDGIFSRFCVGK